MATGNIVYTMHIAAFLVLLLSGIFIVSVRGTGRPIIYMALDRFVYAFLAVVNLFQTAHTPIHGQTLWNPLHLLVMLSAYPLLFAYIFGMVRPGSAGRRFWLTAYLPLAALATLYFTFEALFGKLPLLSNYADMRNCLHLPQLWVLFAAAGFSTAFIIRYSVRATGMLRKHKRNLESNFSYTEGSTLKWIWWVIFLTLLKLFFFLLVIAVEGHTVKIIGMFLIITEPVILTALALRQKDLYSMPLRKEDSSDGAMVERNKGDVGEWSSEKRKKLKQDLQALLEKDEIFKDPELCNEKVCEMLSTNRTYLWQVINQDMNTTFYKLINDSRLNKSVRMMRNMQHRTMPLKSIADICGFKSLGAFSTLFKHTYGKTPTKWRTEAMQDNINPE